MCVLTFIVNLFALSQVSIFFTVLCLQYVSFVLDVFPQ